MGVRLRGVLQGPQGNSAIPVSLDPHTLGKRLMKRLHYGIQRGKIAFEHNFGGTRTIENSSSRSLQ